jgi:hypothetical protein
MPHLMLYGSCLRGYASYAHGLWSGPTEWIIWQITRKRKSANCFIYYEQWMNFCIIYCPLYMRIMQVYHDSDRLHDFGHMPNSGRKEWLWSYVPTPVVLLDSDQHHDSGCISWLTHHGFGQWVCRMSYHPSCERLCMAGLHDYNILQPRHLVRSRLGVMHDLFSVQNLSISRLCMFKSKAMCCTMNDHLAPLDLRESRVSRLTQYPCNSGRSRFLNVWLDEPGIYAAQPWQ